MRACLVVKYDRLKISFKYSDIKAIDDLGKNNLCGLVGVESEGVSRRCKNGNSEYRTFFQIVCFLKSKGGERAW